MKALRWLRGRLQWLLMGLAGVLTLGWAWRRRLRRLGRLKDRTQLEEARAAVARLQGTRDEVRKSVAETDDAVQKLDQLLAVHKRHAVEAFEGGEGLSDEELESAFREALRR